MEKEVEQLRMNMFNDDIMAYVVMHSIIWSAITILAITGDYLSLISNFCSFGYHNITISIDK